MGGTASASPGSVTASAARFSVSPLSALRLESWLQPINVSNSSNYDNGPNTAGIAASQLDNAASVVFGSADNASHTGYVVESNNSNNPLGSPFVRHNLDHSGVAQNGNIKVQHDGLGRRHVVWWQLD